MYHMADIALDDPPPGRNELGSQRICSRQMRSSRVYLILSEMAGAAVELTDALLNQSRMTRDKSNGQFVKHLEMPVEEQLRRLQRHARNIISYKLSTNGLPTLPTSGTIFAARTSPSAKNRLQQTR